MNTTTQSALPSDHAVRESVLDLSKSWIIRAPAGSGKTDVLVKFYLTALTRVNRPEEICFNTFTNLAINEARQRIIEALRRAMDPVPPESAHERQTWELAREVLDVDKQHGWGLLQHPNRLFVTTIDGLSASIASQTPVMSGFGGPTQVDETPDHLYRLAIRDLFASIEDSDVDPRFIEALEVLLNVAENRIDAIESMLIDMLKTRDQWLGVLHDQDAMGMEAVLDGTITDKLHDVGNVLGTYKENILAVYQASDHPMHDACRTLTHWPSPSADTLEEWRALLIPLLTKEGHFRARITKTQGFEPKKEATILVKELLQSLRADDRVAEIERTLQQMLILPAAHYPASLHDYKVALANVLDLLVAHLRVVFEKHGKVDFIEVALRASAALGVGDQVNDTLLKLDYNIRYILVDEWQDVSLSQFNLIKKITSGWESGDGRAIVFVGDQQQSIYSFRDADVGLFLKLWQDQRFGEVPLERATLTTNFRSEKPLVDWFNYTFSEIFPKKADPYDSSVTFSPSTPFHERDDNASVSVYGFRAHLEKEAQNEKIIEIIQQAKKTDPDGSIAILVRARSHLQPIIKALREHKIRFVSQDVDPITNKSATSDVLLLIRALWHPYDRTAWVALLRAPFVGLSWEAIHQLCKHHPHTALIELMSDKTIQLSLDIENQARVTRFLEVHEKLFTDPELSSTLYLRVKTLWTLLGGPACVTPIEHHDVQTIFLLLQQQCLGGEIENMDRFLRQTQALYASPEQGDVQLMTIHKAKGLEFDTVIIPSLEKQARADDPMLLYHRELPHGYLIAPNVKHYDQKDEASERLYQYMQTLKKQMQYQESMRNLYVAITRPRKALHLTALIKEKDGDLVAPAKSSFLGMLWPVVKDSLIMNDQPDTQTFTFAPTLTPPMAPRLPADWCYPDIPVSFKPKRDVAALPSELVIQGESEFKAARGDEITAPLIGTMYHAFMEKISLDGLAAWSPDRVHEKRSSILSGCRRLGMPEPHVEGAAEHIMQLVIATLTSKTGQWILANHEHAKSEWPLSGFIDKQWESAVIDRSFVEDGIRWIIDYKTSGDGVKPEDKDRFIDIESQKYTAQLRRYKKLVTLLDDACPIKTGLYFPGLDTLVEIP
jgi:ATP-dependent exoDNAse (exonuclease V) beta subunit